MLVVGAMVIVLIIPMVMVSSLIDEREQLQQEAIRDIGSKWGSSQHITGPILAIPYKEIIGSDKNETEIFKTAYFLPEKLNITGNVNPETLNRGIYDVTVYNTDLNFSGNYIPPDFEALKIKPENVLWSDAYFCIGITDLKGIKETINISFNGHNTIFKSGIADENLHMLGVSANVTEAQALTLKDGGDFDFKININGSTALNFAPLGKETDATLTSPWNNPGFDGTFLPDKREVTETGFSAEWKVLNLNRGYPQFWTGNSFSPDSSGFGVNLLQPVEQYQKISRSAKYGFLFIFLTYIVFFFVEVINKTRIHPIRYFLVGIALIIFYTLLLSISEVIGFELAYFAAASAVVILITMYSKNFLKKWSLTGFMFLILSSLYGFLYFIIQLQDYSLLAGSVGLFVILAVLMYFSRKINYETETPKDETAVSN
jgi:inner membrane protein